MGNLFSISIDLGSIFTPCKSCFFAKASYIWNLKDNLHALKKSLEDLTEAKEDVLRRIDIAERQQQPRQRRLNLVQLWLTRVQEVETQVNQLQTVRSQEIEKLCLRGYCSKNQSQATNLKAERATFVDVVAERIPEDCVDERPTEPTVGLEPKFDQVWRYVTDSQVKIIGLYGKGGVGKTTLLTQINNKFLNFSDDSVVIWVTVSKDVQLEKIQETIGKKIGLVDGWNSKKLQEKAVDIYRVLSKRKFVLLLDDIWQRVNLVDDIGIPPPSTEIDFKVVFTTRSKEVCRRMETHKTVEVECLTDEEAWTLFREKVGEETLNSHPYIPLLAKEMARECGGLPLALVTIGRAMAGRNQRQEWEFEISILRRAAHEFQGMEEDVFARLKFSYDRLPGDVYRSCFLYCSLFPEDYSISKRELIDCWISEGFLKKYVGMEARNFGYTIIGSLLRACLLEEVAGDYDAYGYGDVVYVDCVKMHDVIRDMALWIACEVEEQEKFLVRSGAGLTRAPEVGEWENVKRMSLMENQITNLTETPNCPQLLTLFLHWNQLTRVTSGFFQHMPRLQVLNLSHNNLTELPVGISALVDLQHLDISFTTIRELPEEFFQHIPHRLQVLNLSHNDLTELPLGISALVDLQHLDLSYTDIIELPEELKALTNLKCLNLEYMRRLCRIPRHVISTLLMLQVLRIFQCGYASIQSKDSILFDEELFIHELVRLENLNVLSISLKSSPALQRFLSSYELLKNCPVVESLCLDLADNDCSNSFNVLSLGVLKDLQTLYFESKGLVESVIDREMRNVPHFHSLHRVYLLRCSKLRDATWIIFAPNLQILEIRDCGYMKEIISVGGEVGEMMMMTKRLPFARLEHLELYDVWELESIYCNPLPFPYLKIIEIRRCPKLKKLPLDSNSMTTRALKIIGKQDWWDELQWEDRDQFLPFFKPG
ncbi:hypothetical protein ACOSP7_020110 [Xanthoceras sorbifolium]